LLISESINYKITVYDLTYSCFYKNLEVLLTIKKQTKNQTDIVYLS